MIKLSHMPMNRFFDLNLIYLSRSLYSMITIINMKEVKTDDSIQIESEILSIKIII